MPETVKPELSVVVIGRNEANNIRRCLTGIFEATKQFSKEIIYVDSCSIDGTVEVASDYDITILALKDKWQISAAAGRYIGTINSRADYILFCDADIQICCEWVCNAFDYIKKNPEVGGVGGPFITHYINSKTLKEIEIEIPKIDGNKIVYSKSLAGGVCMYRRDALVRAGHFNPYLIAEEEWDLAQRVRENGFCLINLPMHSGHHFTLKTLSLKNVFRRQKIWDCFGQLILLGHKRKNFWFEFFTKPARAMIMYFGTFILMVAAIIVLSILNLGMFSAIPILIILIMAAHFAVRRKYIFSFPVFLVRSFYILWRTFIVLAVYKPMNASAYPVDAILIKQSNG